MESPNLHRANIYTTRLLLGRRKSSPTGLGPSLRQSRTSHLRVLDLQREVLRRSAGHCGGKDTDGKPTPVCRRTVLREPPTIGQRADCNVLRGDAWTVLVVGHDTEVVLGVLL